MVVHLVDIHGDTLRASCGGDGEHGEWTTLTDLATCPACLELRRHRMLDLEPEESPVHYWRGQDLYPACGHAGDDEESTAEPSAVTCPGCQQVIARSAASTGPTAPAEPAPC